MVKFALVPPHTGDFQGCNAPDCRYPGPAAQIEIHPQICSGMPDPQPSQGALATIDKVFASLSAAKMALVKSFSQDAQSSCTEQEKRGRVGTRQLVNAMSCKYNH
ncbi:hypothetical protein VTI28DRAFT_10242 [Corynascus sepedonium]